MRVLWITNILFPEINKYLGGSYNHAGGWMISLAENLRKALDIELSVAAVTPLCRELVKYENNDICYYAIPYGRGNISYNKQYCYYWEMIAKDFNPDIVHIHGTEFTHGLSYVEALGSGKVVVSIQGLLTEIAKYSKGGLTICEIIRNITLRDCISKTDLLSESRKYETRAKWERRLLAKVDNVIGRTEWDKIHTLKINPSANYYSVNESMREEFYCTNQWSYASCKKHSIFLSQASCALKGAHFVFRALQMVLDKFPDTIVRIAGNDITKMDSLKDFIKQTNYSRYIRRLIRRLHIADKIEFLGVLDADAMKKEYLSANVFICPSSIENSPNSIGEAQLLGVPIIASNVGGVPSIIDSSTMYEYDDVDALASNICRIFRESQSYDNTQQCKMANIRYNREQNLYKLIEVYNSI